MPHWTTLNPYRLNETGNMHITNIPETISSNATLVRYNDTCSISIHMFYESQDSNSSLVLVEFEFVTSHLMFNDVRCNFKVGYIQEMKSN